MGKLDDINDIRRKIENKKKFHQEEREIAKDNTERYQGEVLPLLDEFRKKLAELGFYFNDFEKSYLNPFVIHIQSEVTTVGTPAYNGYDLIVAPNGLFDGHSSDNRLIYIELLGGRLVPPEEELIRSLNEQLYSCAELGRDFYLNYIPPDDST